MKNLSILTLCLLSFTAFTPQFVKSETINHESQNYQKQYLSDIGATKTIQEGNFQNGEHKTKGTARILQDENGRYYIQFDSNFTTEKGPDLFVILHRSDDILGSSTPPNYPLEKSEYYIVSPLMEEKGKQRYILPGDFDPSQYQSIAVWCRQFNATFGAASLKDVTKR